MSVKITTFPRRERMWGDWPHLPWLDPLCFPSGLGFPRISPVCVTHPLNAFSALLVNEWSHHGAFLEKAEGQPVSVPASRLVNWQPMASGLFFWGCFFSGIITEEFDWTGAMAFLNIGEVKFYWTLALVAIWVYLPFGSYYTLHFYVFVVLFVPERLLKLRCSLVVGRAGRLWHYMLYYSLFGD